MDMYMEMCREALARALHLLLSLAREGEREVWPQLALLPCAFWSLLWEACRSCYLQLPGNFWMGGGVIRAQSSFSPLSWEEGKCTARGPGPNSPPPPTTTRSFLITFSLLPGLRGQSLFPRWECSHTPSPNLSPFSSLACPQNQGLIFISLPSCFKYGQFLI